MKRPKNRSKKRSKKRSKNRALASDTSLRRFPGRLVLLGAGKMGSAMLEGWLARGLDPRKLTVLEPHPPKIVKALVRRGAALNPIGSLLNASAIVIAVKPQSAPEAVCDTKALCQQFDTCAFDHGRPHAWFSRRRIAAGHSNCARDAKHPCRNRTRHHRRVSKRESKRAPAQARDESARGDRQGRMGSKDEDRWTR